MGVNPVKCLHSLFCKNCKVEADGMMTLQSVHSGHLTVMGMPITIPLCFVVFLELDLNEYKRATDKELDVRVLVNVPWGLTVGDVHPEAPFKQISQDKARCNISIPYGQIEFLEYGEYSFEVFVNNVLIHTAVLSIVAETKQP